MGHLVIGRRDLLAGAAAASLAAKSADAQPGQAAATGAPDADQLRRMQWWHQARFGMFIHFGLYAAHGRHEWAMELEAIPVGEYQRFTQGYKPALAEEA
ncbi:MAG TPA: alpha-L-fucosidase [Rhizomicrobium sp.]|jgi:alpha-L-fucosidase|nr:alpha-L-fucosidase [Rhizomicrobium sp.]